MVQFQQKIKVKSYMDLNPSRQGVTMSWGECSSQSALMGKVGTTVTYRFVLWKSRKIINALAFCTSTHTLETWPAGDLRTEYSSCLTLCLVLPPGWQFRGVWFPVLAEREKSQKNGSFCLNVWCLFCHMLISHTPLLMDEVCISTFRFLVYKVLKRK